MDFLSLPWHRQVGIAKTAGVWDDEDNKLLHDIDRRLAWVRRAKEQNRLPELMRLTAEEITRALGSAQRSVRTPEGSNDLEE